MAAHDELKAAMRSGDVTSADAAGTVAMAIANNGLWDALDDIRERLDAVLNAPESTEDEA